MALGFLKGIMSQGLLQVPDFSGRAYALITLFLIVLFTICEWIGRKSVFGIMNVKNYSFLRQLLTYVLLVLTIYSFGSYGKNEFIYFQF